MAKLNVEVVTPERRLAQVSADEVIAPGADGLFGVLPGHTPYLATLQPGLLTVREGAQKTVYFVAGGFVEAGAAAVRVLADAAELVSDIDVAATQKRLATAEHALAALPINDPRVEAARLAVTVEQRRLAAAASK
jgi:F-type H+-transporting ATPase subunit epsilon